MKKLSSVTAAVLVAVLAVTALLVVGLGTGTVQRPGHDPKSSADFSHVPLSRAQGLMPEVVVRPEIGGIVMPTVEVSAYRAVAMRTSNLNVN